MMSLNANGVGYGRFPDGEVEDENPEPVCPGPISRIYVKAYEEVSKRCNLVVQLLKWTVFLLPVSGAIGALCGFFLYALEQATNFRYNNPWMLYLSPVMGVLIRYTYSKVFKGQKCGTDKVLEECKKRETYGKVPGKQALLVVAGTLGTHWVGGSAGREGTAVQLGASIASVYMRTIESGAAVFGYNVLFAGTEVVVLAGVAAGFGGVFGTPISGTIFALEVIKVGSLAMSAIVPCMISSTVSDWSARLVLKWLGTDHVMYPELQDVVDVLTFSGDAWVLVAQVIAASIMFGISASAFAFLMHNWRKEVYEKILKDKSYHLYQPILGSIILIAARWAVQSTDYLGIGVTSQYGENGVSILNSFRAGTTHWYSWIVKLVTTATTLTSGFIGGEVTPLFFVGATLGNWIAWLFNAEKHVKVFASCGFVAVFGAATNTPLASTLMGTELFGGRLTFFLFVSCAIAYAFSYQSSIYTASEGEARRTTEMTFVFPIEFKKKVSPDPVAAKSGSVAQAAL